MDDELTPNKKIIGALKNAESVIRRAIELMTDEQVGQWRGVRSWLEDELPDSLEALDELEQQK